MHAHHAAAAQTTSGNSPRYPAPLVTCSTTTEVTGRLFSPSTDTIASVTRSTFCCFCSW
jgi:hypothetical protein